MKEQLINGGIKQIIMLAIAVAPFVGIIASLTAQLPPAEAQNQEIDLIAQQIIWQPFSKAFVSQNESSLEILVVTNYTDKLWNRAYLPIRIISSNNNSIPFTLDYSSKSYAGNATFYAEIRDNSTREILWNNLLKNTSGHFLKQTFSLPATVLNTPVEFRLYVITDAPGEHTLAVKRAVLSFSNVTQPIKVITS